MRHSAAVLMTRSTGEQLEVFLVERSPKLRFFGGYWAFPGGVVDDVDQLDNEDRNAPAALERAALRELFEETGLLVGELAQAMLHIREGRHDDWWRVYDEAVQVAVMAMRAALKGDPTIGAVPTTKNTA